MSALAELKEFVPQPIRLLPSRTRNFVRTALAYTVAANFIRQIEQMPHSPFEAMPRPGHLRGIDFHDPFKLTWTLALAIVDYKATHGVFPNIVEPRRFNEKIVWSMFFEERSIPASGNKLLTSEFIPDDLKDAVSCPKIVWHSPEPKLPSNMQIAPATYYLKASHGSGMLERISFPLKESERRRLEKKAMGWLRRDFGSETGEWWYCAFKREILLEEALCEENKSVACLMHVFNGEVLLIAYIKKSLLNDNHVVAWLDKDFNFIFSEPRGQELLSEFQIAEETKLRLKKLGSGIGRQFRYARVDFLMDNNKRTYLNEITFSPNRARNRWPDYLDLELGEKWVLGVGCSVLNRNPLDGSGSGGQGSSRSMLRSERVSDFSLFGSGSV